MHTYMTINNKDCLSHSQHSLQQNDKWGTGSLKGKENIHRQILSEM